MSVKNSRVGVLLTSKQAKFVNSIAKKETGGNVSEAIRNILDQELARSKENKVTKRKPNVKNAVKKNVVAKKNTVKKNAVKRKKAS